MKCDEPLEFVVYFIIWYTPYDKVYYTSRGTPHFIQDYDHYRKKNNKEIYFLDIKFTYVENNCFTIIVWLHRYLKFNSHSPISHKIGQLNLHTIKGQKNLEIIITL